MRERGIGTGAITGIVVGIVVVTVPIVVAVILISGGGPSEVSKLEMIITPSTLHIGDSYTMTLRVTNKESGTMTITGLSDNEYLDNQWVHSADIPATSPTFIATSIPPGQTVALFSSTTTCADIMYGRSAIGTWRADISLDTNYGALSDSVTWTVLS